MPGWDLALVLRVLPKEPYKYAQGIPQTCRLESSGLGAVASGSRGSGFHAMRGEVIMLNIEGSVPWYQVQRLFQRLRLMPVFTSNQCGNTQGVDQGCFFRGAGRSKVGCGSINQVFLQRKIGLRK